MRKWISELINADVDLTSYVRNKKQIAKLEVLYYPEENEIVRKEIIISHQEKRKIYDTNEIIED